MWVHAQPPGDGGIRLGARVAQQRRGPPNVARPDARLCRRLLEFGERHTLLGVLRLAGLLQLGGMLEKLPYLVVAIVAHWLSIRSLVQREAPPPPYSIS